MSRIRLTLTALACLGLAHCGGATHASDREFDKSWIVQYQPDLHPMDVGVYRDLLRNLPERDGLVVVVSKDEHAEQFRSALADDARIRIVRAPAPVTPWARDRYLLFESGKNRFCVARPWYELPADQRGDGRVPNALHANERSLVVIRSPIAPIGGDAILTDRHVLVGETSVGEAIARSGLTPPQLLQEYEELFGRKPVIVPSATLEVSRLHIDLFVAWASNRTLVVTDPSLAADVLSPTSFRDPRYGTFTATRNRRIKRGLDKVAASLEAQGYTVRRIPGLFGEPHGRLRLPTVLSYTNCVVTGSRVLMPVYGIPDLDRAAEAVWRALGFECARIRCDGAIVSGGGIRCLTNHLQ